MGQKLYICSSLPRLGNMFYNKFIKKKKNERPVIMF